jgi:hypothetical protein
MKWKIAVVLAALAMWGCSTVPPPGSRMAGWVKELYSGAEVQRRAPLEKWEMLISVFGAENLRGQNVLIQTRSYKSVFGDGPASYAYVPPKFRDRIKTGDMVIIRVAASGPHSGEYAVLTDLNPPNCKSVSPYVVGSPEIYCGGKPAKLVVQQ